MVQDVTNRESERKRACSTFRNLLCIPGSHPGISSDHVLVRFPLSVFFISLKNSSSKQAHVNI